MQFKTLFFDLDATLYPASNGLWDDIKERIVLYTIQRTGLPREEAQKLRLGYLEQYGTTLAGLQRHYQVDPRDYLDYVHGMPLKNYLTPAPELRAMLESLPQRLWVFTNSDKPHVERVLKILEIEGIFEGVADIYALDFDIKPTPIAYQKTLALSGNPDPETCLLLDDRIENLITARELGFYTVLVGGDPHPQADLHIQGVLDLPKQMPQLWKA